MGFIKRSALLGEVKAHTLRTAVRVKDLELSVVRLRQEIETLKEDQGGHVSIGADIYVGTLMGVHLYAYGNHGLSPQTRADLDKFFRSVAAMGGK